LVRRLAAGDRLAGAGAWPWGLALATLDQSLASLFQRRKWAGWETYAAQKRLVTVFPESADCQSAVGPNSILRYRWPGPGY